DLLFNLRLVYIHGIRPDIHEDNFRSPQHEGVRSGYKGIGRHDHLIPGTDIRQKSRHLQRMGARSGQQNFLGMIPFLNPSGTLLGKRAVPAQLSILYRFLYIFHLSPHKGSSVKLNHPFPPSVPLISKALFSSQRIDQNTRNDDQISRQSPPGNFLSQYQRRKNQNENIGKGIDHRTVFHIHPRIGIGVQQQYAEKYTVSGNHSPVQIFKYGMAVRFSRADFQQDLGNRRKKSPRKHQKHIAIHISATPSLPQTPPACRLYSARKDFHGKSKQPKAATRSGTHSYWHRPWTVRISLSPSAMPERICRSLRSSVPKTHTARGKQSLTDYTACLPVLKKFRSGRTAEYLNAAVYISSPFPYQNPP